MMGWLATGTGESSEFVRRELLTCRSKSVTGSIIIEPIKFEQINISIKLFKAK